MKALVLPAALVSFGLVALTGCKHNEKPADPAPAAAVDLKPIEPANQPPVVVQPAPAPAEPAASSSSNSSKASISSKKYTVVKGDTLYSIARRRYGSGSAANISKIEKANPGVHSGTLKIGQVLNLP